MFVRPFWLRKTSALLRESSHGSGAQYGHTLTFCLELSGFRICNWTCNFTLFSGYILVDLRSKDNSLTNRCGLAVSIFWTSVKKMFNWICSSATTFLQRFQCFGLWWCNGRWSAAKPVRFGITCRISYSCRCYASSWNGGGDENGGSHRGCSSSSTESCGSSSIGNQIRWGWQQVLVEAATEAALLRSLYTWSRDFWLERVVMDVWTIRCIRGF